MQRPQTSSGFVVWIDHELGISRPSGDGHPRCSLCCVDLPGDQPPPPLILLHDVPSGRAVWLYCEACIPRVHHLLAGDPDA